MRNFQRNTLVIKDLYIDQFLNERIRNKNTLDSEAHLEQSQTFIYDGAYLRKTKKLYEFKSTSFTSVWCLHSQL